MSILVTGCSGFIASNLCERLVNNNEKVVGIDYSMNTDFLQPIINNKNFEFIHDDVQNIETYIDKLIDVDKVYHLASKADIRQSLTDTTMDLKCVNDTHAVLEFVRKMDIKNLVFTSSAVVYGDPTIIPTPETAPLRPISQYGASKVASETFISVYSSLYDINTLIFRFANVLGKNVHRGVVYDFYHKLKVNPKELEILGDGKQEKTMFEISDCLDALTKFPLNHPLEIYNLGNTQPISITSLAEIVAGEMGLNPKFRYTGGKRSWKGDTRNCFLSINKASKAGWKPKYDVEETIRRTVRWLNE